MSVYRYATLGGKDLIADYLKSLPKDEQAEGQLIMTQLEQKGLDYLKEILDTRQIEKKLWEIKFLRKNRFFYIIADVDNFYIVHACRKQKGKAEKFEIDKAKQRAKEIGKELGRIFV
ncbi:type II toxin-antitoxin system RelE/ParE family toxin [Desulfosporosinus lacus]|uniref:Phage-related protein n=1 Tax=Desulfosporosinus lacus DSM 15449 TaxID=1121420 RepID=A0A1M5SE84_9FIRM|nr:type II toxin-antitoxin system RelE/ParE family toxin [Desulfosporosinus lacus]SHH36826.1 Phage-related protein [Desulfosporosinus lacus DSM 15449]